MERGQAKTVCWWVGRAGQAFPGTGPDQFRVLLLLKAQQVFGMGKHRGCLLRGFGASGFCAAVPGERKTGDNGEHRRSPGEIGLTAGGRIAAGSVGERSNPVVRDIARVGGEAGSTCCGPQDDEGFGRRG